MNKRKANHRRGNQEWPIHRQWQYDDGQSLGFNIVVNYLSFRQIVELIHRQYWANKTQNEDKLKTTQKTK